MSLVRLLKLPPNTGHGRQIVCGVDRQHQLVFRASVSSIWAFDLDMPGSISRSAMDV